MHVLLMMNSVHRLAVDFTGTRSQTWSFHFVPDWNNTGVLCKIPTYLVISHHIFNFNLIHEQIEGKCISEQWKVHNTSLVIVHCAFCILVFSVIRRYRSDVGLRLSGHSH